MISNSAATIFILSLAMISLFILWSLRSPKQRYLLNRLYVWMLLAYSVWALCMLGMWITPPDQIEFLQFLDALTYIGITIPAFYLMISIVFIKSYDRLPRWCLLFLVIPLCSVVICLTNDWHHLQYQQFSVIRREIIFGPYVFVTGLHSYICLLVACFLLFRFMRENPHRLYVKQCLMLIAGGVVPLAVSLAATFSNWNASITATPLGFLVSVICNGIAIYKFNLLDITPVATQHVLDWISDCYLILSQKGLVISYNKPFSAVFASRYGITENRYLKDCVKEEDISKKTAIYNMITAVDACRDAQTTISYEQSATIHRNGTVQKNYYVTDVSQLVVNKQPVGFVVIFKDITQLKKSMQQLQASQTRMMEQERFAFLGQMIGGLAHNLKTPIMSISGCVSAADNLVDECLASLDHPSVTADDYREIFGEMRDWFQKIQESSAYMSDIITAIKGQATSVGTFNESLFTLEELIKRTTLLMRHELVLGGCTLVAEYKNSQSTILHGDINNLVQVLGNLVSNAIFAQKQVGGGCITVGLEQEDDVVKIYVKDTGPGIPSAVRHRLFKEMTTTKGAQGSGLGLYISNAVVHAKFNGSMWCEDNPGGGAIFGMTIPLHSSQSDPSDLDEGQSEVESNENT
ncbi:MAG: histidine kinase N-terminal 7TM domain-containing protein [Lawsonibacter sp.]|jgi:two-component system sensor histidine kinase HupT/HoxJ